MALIWLADTYSSGAGLPLIRTCVAPMIVGRFPLASRVKPTGAAPRLMPKMLMSSPGATAAGVKDAPSTTFAIIGERTVAAESLPAGGAVPVLADPAAV